MTITLVTLRALVADRGVRAGYAAADRACGRAGVRAGDVPHQGARLPDQQGVREVQQVLKYH